MDTKPEDPMQVIAARRAARASKAKEDAKGRDLADLEALDELEEKLGIHAVRSVQTGAAPPLPGLVVVGMPKQEFKYWQDVVANPKAKFSEKNEAVRVLTDAAILYPDSETYQKIVDKHPGVPTSVHVETIKLAGLAVEEQGKE